MLLMESLQPYPYKGFWIRFVATLIDSIVLTIIILFLFGFSLVIFGAALGEGAGIGMAFLVLILASLATILYKPVTEASDYQGTFGKYTLHTMGNEKPITMRQKFNPIIKKLIVNIPPENNFNRKFIAGLAIVISALDGRNAN